MEKTANLKRPFQDPSQESSCLRVCVENARLILDTGLGGPQSRPVKRKPCSSDRVRGAGFSAALTMAILVPFLASFAF